jgi:hypothetical protein
VYVGSSNAAWDEDLSGGELASNAWFAVCISILFLGRAVIDTDAARNIIE